MIKILKKILYPVSLIIQNFGRNLYDWCMTEMACSLTPTQKLCTDCEIRLSCKKAKYYLDR